MGTRSVTRRKAGSSRKPQPEPQGAALADIITRLEAADARAVKAVKALQAEAADLDIDVALVLRRQLKRLRALAGGGA